MSSGDLTIDGARARYELRMPLYEVAHVPHPETALLDHVRFAGAKLVSSDCRADSARDAYICSAEYEFAAPPDRLEAECTLASITVPNHVHLLRAAMGDKRDQAMFDRILHHRDPALPPAHRGGGRDDRGDRRVHARARRARADPVPRRAGAGRPQPRRTAARWSRCFWPARPRPCCSCR